MKSVELYGQVRRAVYVEGISQREAARRFGIDPRTVAKMLAFSVPPGYRRSSSARRPKLDPFVAIIDQILEEDKQRPTKQHHTAKRIFERLRDEYGYDGGVTIVRCYVHDRRERQREMFVPLRHDPGDAQVDFGAALAIIAGEERKIHFFAMDLPHSDGCVVQAYPAETSEFFGGMPRSILYDMTTRYRQTSQRLLRPSLTARRIALLDRLPISAYMWAMDAQFVSIGEIIIDAAFAPLVVQAARPIPAAAIAMLKYQLAYLLDSRFKPAPPEPRDEMTLEEVRALWGCYHVTILRRIRAGQLHPIEHNGNVLFRRDEVERLSAPA